MRTAVEDALLGCGLFPRGARVLIGVSGGADSMALADGLLRQASRLEIEPVVASFDHRLRDDSAGHVSHVRAWCDERGVPFFHGAGDVAGHARATGASLEAAARELRYAFLEATAEEEGARRIATAHTRDDQVETVLMRLENGAGLRGRVGIHRSRGIIVRPLLDVRRDETLAHCRRYNVAFIDDPSNDDVRFDRNRVRHELLPAMRARRPDADAQLLRIRDAALAAVTRIRAVTSPRLESGVARERDCWVVDAHLLDGLDGLDARARYVLLGDLIHDRIGVGERPGRVHYRELAALFAADAGSGRMVTFPGGCARREYDNVVIFPGRRHPDDGLAGESGARLTEGTSARFDGFDVRAVAVDGAHIGAGDLRAAAETAGPGRPGVAYFDAESLELPLVVRHARPGDRMRPFGMRGRRTLGDILSDRKVPARHRARALVVEDRRRIVWLVGCTTCESTRVRPDTERVLRVDVAPVAPGPDIHRENGK